MEYQKHPRISLSYMESIPKFKKRLNEDKIRSIYESKSIFSSKSNLNKMKTRQPSYNCGEHDHQSMAQNIETHSNMSCLKKIQNFGKINGYVVKAVIDTGSI